MFVVLNMVDGNPGNCHITDTWSRAMDLVVQLAKEQGAVDPESAIREELEMDNDYKVDDHIRIYILAPEAT